MTQIIKDALDKQIEAIWEETPRTIRQIKQVLKERANLDVHYATICRRMKKMKLTPWGKPFARGYKLKCADGHEVTSLGEAKVDEFLDAHRIQHWVHWRIQGPNILTDFYLPDFGLCIEYAGIQGHPEYDKRLAQKTQLYEKWNIPVVIITPETPLDVTLLQEFVRVVQEAQQHKAEDHAILRR